MTSVQLFSIAAIRRLRHLKEVTISSGCPYSQNAAATPARDSASAIHRRFLSATISQSVVVGWCLLIATHVTNMYHTGQ